MALTAFKTDFDALRLPLQLLIEPTLGNFAAASISVVRPILNSIRGLTFGAVR